MADENDSLTETDEGHDSLSGDAGGDTITASEGDTVSRNELHDSIDPQTGGLTEQATELRAEHGITQSGEQIPDEGEPAE